MRIRHRLKALVLLLSACGASAATAQTYLPGMYGGSPAYVPGTTSVPTAGLPQSFASHPYISPFDNAFEQHYNSNGLWFRDAIGAAVGSRLDRRFTVEFTRTKRRGLSGIFGQENIQTYHQQNDPENDAIIPGLEFYNYFDAANANLTPSLISNGLRLGAEWWTPEGVGFLIDGDFQPDSTSVYDARAGLERLRTPLNMALAGNVSGSGIQNNQQFFLNGVTDLQLVENEILAPGVPFDATDTVSYGVFGTTFDVLDRAVMNLHGIPLQTRTPLGNNISGVSVGYTQPFDLQFILRHSAATYGTSIAAAFSPFYDRNGVKIRATVGARYLHLDEALAFYGVDSGLAYGTGDNDTPATAKVHTPPDGIDDDGDLVIDNPSEEGAVTFVQNTPQINAATDQILVKSFLRSEVSSDFAGPEIGLHYIVGEGDGFRVTGRTRVGAMINSERMRLRGDNIGNTEATVIDPITAVVELDEMFPTTPDPLTGLTQNAFSDGRNSTHLSPMFEQKLNLNVPLFRRIPVLKDVWQLEDATLSLGWTFLWVGEVADPTQNVEYFSVPRDGIFPYLNSTRGDYFQNTFNAGIDWSY